MQYGWKRLLINLSVRALPPILVVVFVVIAFQLGVNVSDRGDIPNGDLLTQIYYAVGLFTLGGMDLGMPTEGPIFWRYMLFFAYFIAPMIAAAAVIEGVWLAALPWMIVHWPWRNHVVVAGGGRIARAFIEECRVQLPNTNILVVEKQAEYPNKEVFVSMPRVYPIHGAVDDLQLMKRLQLCHARFFLFMTSDEVANIEMALQISKQEDAVYPSFIRTADLRLMRRANSIIDYMPFEPCVNIHQVVAADFCRTAIEFMLDLNGYSKGSGSSSPNGSASSEGGLSSFSCGQSPKLGVRCPFCEVQYKSD